MSATISAGSATRLFLTLFSNDYHSVGFAVPLGFQIGLTVLIIMASLLIAIKQGRLLTPQSTSTTSDGINKFSLSVVMIIKGGVVFGLGVAILQERYFEFSVLPLHFFGVVVSL